MFSSTQEEVALSRDCEAIVIPHGYRTNLTQGTKLRIVQELGGSVTVTAEFGGLFRLDPEQLDAIGREVPTPPDATTTALRELLRDGVDVLYVACHGQADDSQAGLLYLRLRPRFNRINHQPIFFGFFFNQADCFCHSLFHRRLIFCDRAAGFIHSV